MNLQNTEHPTWDPNKGQAPGHHSFPPSTLTSVCGPGVPQVLQDWWVINLFPKFPDACSEVHSAVIRPTRPDPATSLDPGQGDVYRAAADRMTQVSTTGISSQEHHCHRLRLLGNTLLWRCVCKLSLFSCVWLLENPWTAPQASLSFTISDVIQTHVYWVSDAIQPSHPLPPSSPPTLNLS